MRFCYICLITVSPSGHHHQYRLIMKCLTERKHFDPQLLAQSFRVRWQLRLPTNHRRHSRLRVRAGKRIDACCGYTVGVGVEFGTGSHLVS